MLIPFYIKVIVQERKKKVEQKFHRNRPSGKVQDHGIARNPALKPGQIQEYIVKTEPGIPGKKKQKHPRNIQRINSCKPVLIKIGVANFFSFMISDNHNKSGKDKEVTYAHICPEENIGEVIDFI